MTGPEAQSTGIPKSRVSIAIPRLAGGGAEKVIRLIAGELQRTGRLGAIYCGRAESHGMPVIATGSERAAGAAAGFLRAVRCDISDTFLFNLGFTNLAPLVRLVRPRARIVLRLGNTVGAEIDRLRPLARLRYLAGLRLACRTADQVIMQCDYMRRDAIERLGLPEEKATTIYNPIDHVLAVRRVKSNRPFDGPYFFTAASFKPQKGLETLLAGYARAKNPGRRKLVIAGIAPENAEFAESYRRHGLTPDRVRCLGFLTDIYPYIEHAEACVLASVYEGFSNFLLESAALGKRIIASDCPGGNRELFAHYDNAEMFPVGDAERLAVLLDGPRHDLPSERALEQLGVFSFDTVFEQYCDAIFGTVQTVG